MRKRFGDCILDSNTAYCFGGDGISTLHITRRSKQYFLYNAHKKEITPISELHAQSFADTNKFMLTRKSNVHVQSILPYDTYHKLSKACKQDKEKIKKFTTTAIIDKINKLPPP